MIKTKDTDVLKECSVETEIKYHKEQGHIFLKAGYDVEIPHCEVKSGLTWNEDKQEGIWVKLLGESK